MPRPLSYTSASRMTASIFLKDDLDSGRITRREYNAEIKALNDKELADRDRRERRKQTAAKKKADENERRRQVENARKTALDKIKKALAKRIPVVRERRRIRNIRQQYLDSITVRRTGTSSRFNGNVVFVDYAVEPPVQITPTEQGTDNEAIDAALSGIIDAIDTNRRSGNLHITIHTEHLGPNGPLRFSWAVGKAFKAPFQTGSILGRLRFALNDKGQKSVASNVTVNLIGVTFKYTSVLRSGGCDGDTHHKTFGDLKILSPKSSKNNCLFACIHHKLGKRIMCDTTRKELNIPLDTPIHTNDLFKIAKYYDICIRLFDLKGNLTSTYNTEGAVQTDIMLYVNNNGLGHYVLIEGETHTCDKCGKYWVKKHTCNITYRRKMWLNRMSGNRNVIPIKIEREKDFDVNSILYYDLETFKPYGTEKIVVYAASWFCDGQYYQCYGKDSWNEFMEFVLRQSDKIICAYNGAGFDFHFLMNDLISRGLELKNVILSGSKLMSLKFGKNMRLWDICLFTLSSLKDACKSFGVSAENAKTEFDHNRIKSWEDVESCRSEVEPYIKRDVLGMKEVVEKYSDMLFKTFKVHMTEFVTLSAMSYAIWTNSTKEILELPDTEKYEFIRESLYGGRTYPQQREFTSKQYNEIVNATSSEELKQTYKKMDDWIFNADATSLYPTAMVKYEYPLGNSFWVEGSDIDRNAPLKIGIYDVEITPNPNLIVPILPQKTENGGINWNLLPRRSVYTSADIENALKYGYTLDKIHKALVYNQKGDIFSDYIMKCYKIKEENDDNPVLRQIGKILMNALYGKMLERARFEETKICNNIEDVWKFQEEFSMSDVMFIGDKVITIGLPEDAETSDKRIRKPSQIGTFILAYSRRHMLDAMSAIEPSLDKHFFTYTDTDSLHIHCSKLPGLEQKGWLSKGLGQLSDDAKGGKIFREINLAPKLYMYLCLMPDGKIKTCMKSKGIPSQYLSPHLFNDADTLEDDEKLILMENRLKKVGLGRNLQLDWRKYDAFSILSVDMERTFYKNQWKGMRFDNGLWYPNK